MVSCFTNLMKNQYHKRKCVAFTLYFRISVLQNTISFWVMGGFISFHFSSVFIYLFFFVSFVFIANAYLAKIAGMMLVGMMYKRSSMMRESKSCCYFVNIICLIRLTFSN